MGAQLPTPTRTRMLARRGCPARISGSCFPDIHNLAHAPIHSALRPPRVCVRAPQNAWQSAKQAGSYGRKEALCTRCALGDQGASATRSSASAFAQTSGPEAIQKDTRVLISLWDSLMFGRVPKNAAPCLSTRPNISESHSERSTRSALLYSERALTRLQAGERDEACARTAATRCG